MGIAPHFILALTFNLLTSACPSKDALLGNQRHAVSTESHLSVIALDHI